MDRTRPSWLSSLFHDDARGTVSHGDHSKSQFPSLDSDERNEKDNGQLYEPYVDSQYYRPTSTGSRSGTVSCHAQQLEQPTTKDEPNVQPSLISPSRNDRTEPSIVPMGGSMWSSVGAEASIIFSLKFGYCIVN